MPSARCLVKGVPAASLPPELPCLTSSCCAARGVYEPLPNSLSRELRDLVSCMLTVDPEERIIMIDILQHQWLQVRIVMIDILQHQWLQVHTSTVA
jgi:serine/threonine protein kinase